MASRDARKKRRDDHVIVHDGGGEKPAGMAECLGCGDTMQIPTPIRFDMLAAMGDAYVKQHLACAGKALARREAEAR